MFGTQKEAIHRFFDFVRPSSSMNEKADQKDESEKEKEIANGGDLMSWSLCLCSSAFAINSLITSKSMSLFLKLFDKVFYFRRRHSDRLAISSYRYFHWRRRGDFCFCWPKWLVCKGVLKKRREGERNALIYCVLKFTTNATTKGDESRGETKEEKGKRKRKVARAPQPKGKEGEDGVASCYFHLDQNNTPSNR